MDSAATQRNFAAAAASSSEGRGAGRDLEAGEEGEGAESGKSPGQVGTHEDAIVTRTWWRRGLIGLDGVAGKLEGGYIHWLVSTAYIVREVGSQSQRASLVVDSPACHPEPRSLPFFGCFSRHASPPVTRDLALVDDGRCCGQMLRIGIVVQSTVPGFPGRTALTLLRWRSGRGACRER